MVGVSAGCTPFNTFCRAAASLMIVGKFHPNPPNARVMWKQWHYKNGVFRRFAEVSKRQFNGRHCYFGAVSIWFPLVFHWRQVDADILCFFRSWVSLSPRRMSAFKSLINDSWIIAILQFGFLDATFFFATGFHDTDLLTGRLPLLRVDFILIFLDMSLPPIPPNEGCSNYNWICNQRLWILGLKFLYFYNGEVLSFCEPCLYWVWHIFDG